MVQLDNPKLELYNRISQNKLDFHWYSAKAKVRMETDRINGGGRMNIRMVSDSIIWFNFKKVSIEGARCLITPETFTILYRQEKKYENGRLSELLNQSTLNLSFEEMQSFIAGRVPMPFEFDLKYQKTDNFHYLLGNNEKYRLVYWFNEELSCIRYEMTDDQNRKLQVDIAKYDEDLGIYKNRKLTYFQNQIKEGTLELDLANIEIDIPKKLPFSIPAHYTQL